MRNNFSRVKNCKLCHVTRAIGEAVIMSVEKTKCEYKVIVSVMKWNFILKFDGSTEKCSETLHHLPPEVH